VKGKRISRHKLILCKYQNAFEYIMLKKTNHHKWRVIVVCLLGIIISINIINKGDTLDSNVNHVWVSHSLNRINIDQNASPDTKINLFAARGEYESFQIGIKVPEGKLTNTNVFVSDLSGPNNKVISKSNITLFREHYVRVSQSSPKEATSYNSPLPPGLYADALIPFVSPDTQKDLSGGEFDAIPFNLIAGAVQPIWVDIFIPRDTQPGQYTGKYSVISDQEEFTGEISLKVWNFALPLKPYLNSSFLVWNEANKNTLVELLKHRIMPAGDIEPSIQKELTDNWGLNSLRLPYFSGANYTNCNMSAAPSTEEIKSNAAKNQSNVLQYVYSVDEIDECPNLIEPLKQWAKNIKKAGVKHLVAMAPTPEIYEDNSFADDPAVDIWAVLPKMYEESRNRINDVINKGSKVWFYNDMALDNYSPKWLIDYAPINFRIPHGFINQSLGLSGVLYWRVDFWQGNPWKDEQRFIQDGKYYPGEGMLVYPGQQVGISGVVPSMRLKWIRDGVEDYEYMEILKRNGRTDLALEVARSVGSGWKNWTSDTKILQDARQKLGAEIEKLSL
jgi:hypothetical protein